MSRLVTTLQHLHDRQKNLIRNRLGYAILQWFCCQWQAALAIEIVEKASNLATDNILRGPQMHEYEEIATIPTKMIFARCIQPIDPTSIISQSDQTAPTCLTPRDFYTPWPPPINLVSDKIPCWIQWHVRPLPITCRISSSV